MAETSISQDDLEDVREMTDKIELFIQETIEDCEERIAMSSIMSASINCILMQCKSVQMALFYRNIFISILDDSISNIRLHLDRDDQPLQ
jgi:hypothetical protein